MVGIPTIEAAQLEATDDPTPNVATDPSLMKTGFSTRKARPGCHSPTLESRTRASSRQPTASEGTTLKRTEQVQTPEETLNCHEHFTPIADLTLSPRPPTLRLTNGQNPTKNPKSETHYPGPNLTHPTSYVLNKPRKSYQPLISSFFLTQATLDKQSNLACAFQIETSNKFLVFTDEALSELQQLDNVVYLPDRELIEPKKSILRIDYCDARPFCATHIKLLFLF